MIYVEFSGRTPMQAKTEAHPSLLPEGNTKLLPSRSKGFHILNIDKQRFHLLQDICSMFLTELVSLPFCCPSGCPVFTIFYKCLLSVPATATAPPTRWATTTMATMGNKEEEDSKPVSESWVGFCCSPTGEVAFRYSRLRYSEEQI